MVARSDDARQERAEPSQVPAPELLAPAGGPDALVAAVRNGADAVYLGLAELNARRGAENFDLATLAEATRYAHLRGVRVYLTANVLVLEEELEAAVRMVDNAWAAGVDAVIVQDLGLLRMVRAALPEVRIHASTQVNAHNLQTVRTLASLGVSRVTLARETSLTEIAILATDGGVEIESFVHGSLCYCYSGQCLMSSIIGARSANRGLCAQPCRLPYDLASDEGLEARTVGRYLLSPQDLAGIGLLPRLIGAGVAALKIEGRMKSPEYVALVTGVYRAALDRAIPDPEGFRVLPAEQEILAEAFSRGFTEGALTRQRGADFMSWQRPNNRGVPLGRIVTVERGRATVALDRGLAADDRIEVWTSSGRFAQRVGELSVRGNRGVRAPAGEHAEFASERALRVGDRVFRVENADLIAAARRSITGPEPRPVPVDVEVRLRMGEPLRVALACRDGHASAEGPIVEPARTKAITAEEVIEHVGRFGGTPYAAGAWSIDMDAGAGLGFSSLHETRRRAVESLDAARLAPWTQRAAILSLQKASPDRAVRLKKSRTRTRRTRPDVVAVVSSAEAATACLARGADVALVAIDASDALQNLPSEVGALLPRIAHDREWATLPQVPASVTAGNLGQLVACALSGDHPDADWPLNVVNAQAAAALADLGASLVWASPELSGQQLARLAADSPVPIGALALGRFELMVAEVCTLMALGPCDGVCAACERRARTWRLVDRKGYEFPVRTDALGRSHILNSVPLDLTRALPQLLDANLAALRLELADLTVEDAAQLVGGFVERLEAAQAGIDVSSARPLLEPATSGHFFRGVR